MLTEERVLMLITSSLSLVSETSASVLPVHSSAGLLAAVAALSRVGPGHSPPRVSATKSRVLLQEGPAAVMLCHRPCVGDAWHNSYFIRQYLSNKCSRSYYLLVISKFLCLTACDLLTSREPAVFREQHIVVKKRQHPGKSCLGH